MKSCTIHFLQALAGDCFVLEFKNKECIIIDCGFKTTYRSKLKPLLQKLARKGCRVTLLVITHADRDHIEGAIEFIKENGKASCPSIITVENVWYNGIYNTLCYNPELKERMSECSISQDKKINHYLSEKLSQLPDTAGDISASNCIDFEQLCINNGYKINSNFPDGIVKRNFSSCDEKSKASVQIGKCRITVLSPSQNEIVKLSKALHYDLLSIFGRDYAISQDSRFVKLCEIILETTVEKINQEEFVSASIESIDSWVGTSRPTEMNDYNKASIVIEIQYEDLKMLFTGDSESELWYKYLEKEYDVVKISHHGTTKPNVKMIGTTKGRFAYISTNGYKNNLHPEKDTIARLILAGYKTICFNYNNPYRDILIKNQGKYEYEVLFEQTDVEL